MALNTKPLKKYYSKYSAWKFSGTWINILKSVNSNIYTVLKIYIYNKSLNPSSYRQYYSEEKAEFLKKLIEKKC